MSEFEKVEVIPAKTRRPRGRVSWPLLDNFVKSGLEKARLKPEAISVDYNPAKVARQMQGYLKSHPQYPVKITIVEGDIFLERLDLAEEEDISSSSTAV